MLLTLTLTNIMHFRIVELVDELTEL